MKRPDPPPPIWHEPMRTPRCRYGHPLIDVRDKTMVMEYRMDGHVLQTCRTCEPHSYAFGVATTYHSMVTFYAIDQSQLQSLLGFPSNTQTLDLLTFLGYRRSDAA